MSRRSPHGSLGPKFGPFLRSQRVVQLRMWWVPRAHRQDCLRDRVESRKRLCNFRLVSQRGGSESVGQDLRTVDGEGRPAGHGGNAAPSSTRPRRIDPEQSPSDLDDRARGKRRQDSASTVRVRP